MAIGKRGAHKGTRNHTTLKPSDFKAQEPQGFRSDFDRGSNTFEYYEGDYLKPRAPVNQLVKKGRWNVPPDKRPAGWKLMGIKEPDE